MSFAAESVKSEAIEDSEASDDCVESEVIKDSVESEAIEDSEDSYNNILTDCLACYSVVFSITWKNLSFQIP